MSISNSKELKQDDEVKRKLYITSDFGYYQYRVWDILNNKMLYWKDIMDLPAWEIFPGTPEQRAYKVMANLELQDKYQKELYVGDIVKTKGRAGMSVLVLHPIKGVCNAVYTPNGWRYYSINKNEFNIYQKVVSEFVKVGDIYTNKDLLDKIINFTWRDRDDII